MSYDPDDYEDPRNMIRRCPHCGEIWMKVEGCDGQTRCGERGWENGWADSIETKTMKLPTVRYEFKFTEDLKFLGLVKTAWEVIQRFFSQPSYNRQL